MVDVAGVLDVEHSADEGRLNARKMVAGAPVAVRFDFKSSAAYRHIVVEWVLNVLVPMVLNTLGNGLMAYLKSSYRFNVKPLRPVMGQAVVSGNANIAQAAATTVGSLRRLSQRAELQAEKSQDTCLCNPIVCVAMGPASCPLCRSS